MNAGAPPGPGGGVEFDRRSGERADRVVGVVADVPAVRKVFHYAVPPALDAQVRIGTQVRVSLHGRRVGGWVTDGDAEPDPGLELRPLLAVRGWGPPPSVLELARWAAWRWAGTLVALLRTASSPVAVRNLPGTRPTGPLAARGPLSAPVASVAPAGGVAAVAGEALRQGVSVVRIAPAADPAPVWDAAAACLAPGPPDRGVLVLAPESERAAEVARRLRVAGWPVALLPGDWAAARAGGVVVVGSRAAAFAPLPRLAAAVVLDAHDQAYHEERTPTWHAWGVVAERARRDGAPCALVSACPSLELLATGRLVTTSRHTERLGWPAVEVVDRRGDDPRLGLFSARAVEGVRWAAAGRDRRVVCIVNRTGGARLVVCSECNEPARCEACGAALELVEDDEPGSSARGVLRCRRCGAGRPPVCAHCGGARLKARRLGVARVRKEVEALTNAPVAVVSGSPKAESDGPPAEDVAVVVGTEAALHRIRRADVVVFLDFDHELLAPRFEAGEQALALLARAARLVGTSAAAGSGLRAPGRVVVQTRLPGDGALQAAVRADPGVLTRADEEVRRQLGLPPFGALARVSGDAAATYVDALADASSDGVSVGGADGVFTVRAPDHAVLCDLLAAVARPSGRLRVEVDPVRA